MAEYSLFLVIIVTATFFLAGIVKGVTGMGLPTVAMGVLGALLSPLAAASLLIIPSFVTNFWQLWAGPDVRNVIARLWLMMLAIVIGTVAGASLLTSGNTKLTTAALGCALVVYAGYTLFARQLRVPAAWQPWLSPIVGGITGIVTGGTGVFVIPAVPYLQALAIGLIWRGAFQVDNLALSALALIPALAGMWAGQIIRNRVSPQTFRRWFLIALLILGIEMMTRSIFA